MNEFLGFKKFRKAHFDMGFISEAIIYFAALNNSYLKRLFNANLIG